MFLIVGLGNPGAKYKDTFHNVGFMTVDALAKKNKLKFNSSVCDAKVAKSKVCGEEVVLAKPQTFMNLSGISVKKLVKKFCSDERRELIVVYDDADLPVGRMRLREEGSAGTHNGMRSIVKELDATDFKRLRIGIKNEELAEKRVEMIDYVLLKPDFDDKLILDKCIDAAADALGELISGLDIQRVEEKINKRK